jgi:hypothetical protein
MRLGPGAPFGGEFCTDSAGDTVGIKIKPYVEKSGKKGGRERGGRSPLDEEGERTIWHYSNRGKGSNKNPGSRHLYSPSHAVRHAVRHAVLHPFRFTFTFSESI